MGAPGRRLPVHLRRDVLLAALARESDDRGIAVRVGLGRAEQIVELRVEFAAVRLQLRDQRGAGLAILRKSARREKNASGAVAQHVVVVHGAAAKLRHGHRRGSRGRGLAVAEQLARVAAAVAGTAEVFAEAAALQLHLGPAFFAGQDRPLVALETELAALHRVAVAVRVVPAQVQLARLVDQVGVHDRVALRAAALGAQPAALLLVVRIRGHGLLARHEVERARTTLRGRQCVAGAAQKYAGARGAHLHGPAARVARDVRGSGLVGPHPIVGACGGQPLGKILVERVQYAAPLALADRDLVQVPLHAGGERIVEQVGKILDQPVGHEFADLLRVEAALPERDVAPLLDGGDDRRISGGSADAALFQFADETGFAVAGRRFGEMLAGFDAVADERLALREVGQFGFVLLVRARRGGQHFREPVEAQNASARAQLELPGLHRDRCAEIFGARHLAGDELAPDQVVEAPRVPVRDAYVVRPDR